MTQPLTFTTHPTIEHWRLFTKHLQQTVYKNHKTWLDKLWITWPAYFVIALVLFALHDWWSPRPFDNATAVVTFVFMLVNFMGLIYNATLKQQAYAPRQDGNFLQPHQYTIDEHGIQAQSKHSSGQHDWFCVNRIDRVANKNNPIILVFLDTMFAHIIPENQLQNPDATYQTLVAFYKAANPNAKVSSDTL